MDQEIRDIHDLRRCGVHVFELWHFILNSKRHRKAWGETTSHGNLDLSLWRFMLAPERRKWLEKWEENSSILNPLDIRWKELISSCPVTDRIQAIKLLENTPYPEAVSLLVQFFNDDVSLVLEVLKVLKTFSPRLKIPILINALKNTDPCIRSWATMALGEIRSEAKCAIPALVRALKDEHVSVRSRAANALGQIGATRNIVPALTQALQDKNWYVCSMVARTLGQIGSDASCAVPALVETIKHRHPGMEESLMALGRIGQEASFAVPTLVKIIREEMKWSTFLNSFLTAAIEALGGIGQGATHAVPTLISVLNTPDESVHQVATSALYRITGQNFNRELT
ncbi:MAG: HEAT repeat domain-containing protein [Planctomycetota bacterium]